jgi:hypothetical protein
LPISLLGFIYFLLNSKWSLFDSGSREVFRHALDVDDGTWLRGKGWALSIALIIIPYYLHTNPVLVSVAKRMIDEILADI